MNPVKLALLLVALLLGPSSLFADSSTLSLVAINPGATDSGSGSADSGADSKSEKEESGSDGSKKDADDDQEEADDEESDDNKDSDDDEAEDDEAEDDSEDENDAEGDDKDSDQPKSAKKKTKSAKQDDDQPAEKKSADKKDSSKEKEADAKKGPKRKTHTIEAKPLKVEVALTGGFIAKEAAEIALRPESWRSYEIKEVAPHGAKVSKGDLLFQFDPKDLEEAIKDLEIEQRLEELALIRTEEDLPRLEKTIELALTDAKQFDERTSEDYKQYQDEERALIVRSAEMRLRAAKQALQYEQDEMEQLEKMYKSDDLTEETEELILNRQREAVAQAKFGFEVSEYLHKLSLNTMLPRQDVDFREELDRTRVALERAKTAAQLDLTRARYELEQLKVRRAKSLERHADLLADRELLEVRSPADGVVYYGQCVDGSWNDVNSYLQKFKTHNEVPTDTVLMTIVSPRDLAFEAKVGEKSRPDVAVGQSVKLQTAYEEAAPIKGAVASVESTPNSSNSFPLKIELVGDAPEWLRPGMTAKAKVMVYEKKKALLAPKAAVRTEEEDEEAQYVWIVTGKGDSAKVEKRSVTTGKKKGDEVEILTGLEEGDVISLEDEAKRVKEAKEKAEKEAKADDSDDSAGSTNE